LEPHPLGGSEAPGKRKRGAKKTSKGEKGGKQKTIEKE